MIKLFPIYGKLTVWRNASSSKTFPVIQGVDPNISTLWGELRDDQIMNVRYLWVPCIISIVFCVEWTNTTPVWKCHIFIQAMHRLGFRANNSACNGLLLAPILTYHQRCSWTTPWVQVQRTESITCAQIWHFWNYYSFPATNAGHPVSNKEHKERVSMKWLGQHCCQLCNIFKSWFVPRC